MEKVKCICCNKTLEHDSCEIHQYTNNGCLYGGLICHVSGNYGSSVFDPIDNDNYLELYICDDCITIHAQKIKHVTTKVKVVDDSSTEMLDKYLEGMKNDR
jgi:hypothetical protein